MLVEVELGAGGGVGAGEAAQREWGYRTGSGSISR